MSASPTADVLQEALALHRRGAVTEAAARYAEVLRLDPGNADAHYYLGLMACQQGRFADGAKCARRSLANDAVHVRAHVLLARALSALGEREEALASFDRAIALAPDSAQAHGGRADVLSDLGRNAEAIDGYDRALALEPDAVEDWFNRGLALITVGRNDEAIASFDRAIAGRERFALAHLRRAQALSALRRHIEALADVDRALAIEPDLAAAWLGRGNVLTELKRQQDAFTAFERALAIKPDLAEAWLGRGNALSESKGFDEAFAAYERALSFKPDLAEAWLGRGNVLIKLKRFDEALAAYDRALSLKGDLAEAWVGRGNIAADLKRHEDAAAAYERALAQKPDLAEAWLGRANVLTELQHYDQAFAAYDGALALKPDMDYAAGARMLAKLLVCDWKNLTTEATELLAAIRSGKPASAPFAILPLPSTAADQLHCATRYVQDQPRFPQIWQGEVYTHDRIRVAYLSADFHETPMAALLAGLFEQHDRSRFEVTAISFGPEQDSPVRRRLRDAFERFVDVRLESDQAIAELVRRLEIDIAVDLMGFTRRNRLHVLARRAAPVQVNYLGFPGTMGADYIDYILADTTLIPEAECRFYSEQVVWLPHTYLANDNRRVIAERTVSRAECGLPDEAFVFCCFNNSFKIMPEVFDIWMRLLGRIEGSVLWLLEGDAAGSANLRREAQARNISPDRLIFAPRVTPADHLARHRQADLFLDTLPYNAHTTASDALWSGLPVLTCLGATFVGRVAASALKAIGLNGLITHSLEDYEALALKLAREPALLAAFKAKLTQNRDSCALFDTARSARAFEAAYTMMWERYRRGETPRSRPGPAKPIRIA
jgi:protein O-GlcNAc transferase